LTKLLSGRIYQELYIVGGENGDIIYWWRPTNQEDITKLISI
jgi:hypothetical protein